jgi:hypothetical protein
METKNNFGLRVKAKKPIIQHLIGGNQMYEFIMLDEGESVKALLERTDWV